ncbi:LysR family transcriptional regulator [uncultured Roseobacter sp.]|uniref:LysR family transcriptional regulator n=1 Tax=uncultured Roseobacter sp. TaxID=114847 RepID=UPI00260C8C29|nr:LysR family transcriptional regulator [uncultured Roseobacter sp.]
MKISQMNLTALAVFSRAAEHGSVSRAAQETGLSSSTASHHLRKLEELMGVALFDHQRRPLTLTTEGETFLPRVLAALSALEQGATETLSGALGTTRQLRMAMVEDFDSEISPELARHLAVALPRCTFEHLTRPSHEVISLVKARDIDVGVGTEPTFGADDITSFPLLRDPFVLVVPRGLAHPAEAYLDNTTGLPFLRYSHRQIMSTRIEAQLQRMRVQLPQRFEFESNQSLLGLVADGAGWTITTPTNYLRGRRFHRQVSLLPFPGSDFGRTLSIYLAKGYSMDVLELIDVTLRRLIEARAIDPLIADYPWLREQFRLLPRITPVS